MSPWRPLPSKPPGKAREAAVTFRPLQPEQASGVGPLGQFPASFLRKKPGSRATLGSLRFLPPGPTSTTSLYWAPLCAGSEPNSKHASSHVTCTVAYEMSQVLSILLMRKLRQRLVKQFAQCHPAHKRWGQDQIPPRPT